MGCTDPKKEWLLTPSVSLLGALGVLGGGAAGIAKAINDAKADKQKLKEQKRYNVMEATVKAKGLPRVKGQGFFLKYPYLKNLVSYLIMH